MPWRIRPQGSPQTVDNLSLQQLLEGLEEERWETSDLVLGPNDKQWVPVENHPQLAEIALELEAAKVEKEEVDPEEQRIDMNPLIDVCLVLLVFFILATAMSVLEKVLAIPNQGPSDEQPVQQVSIENVRDKMVTVVARKDGYKVDETPVNADGLAKAVKDAVAKKRSRGNERPPVVLDAVGVEWGAVVAVIDAAAGANSSKVNFLKRSRPAAAPRPGG
jgi:biopolymer transport protein ExbD